MKTFVSILLIFLFSFTITDAQNRMSAGAGLVVALPMGSFGDYAGTGFGVTGAFEMGFTPNITGVGQIGYISWGGKEAAGYSYGYSAVPLTVGIKYYFTPGTGFYGTSALGFHFFSADVEVPTFNVNGYSFGGSSSASSTDFTFSIGAGYEMPLNENIILDFAGMFNLISDANYITIRAGAKMGL